MSKQFPFFGEDHPIIYSLAAIALYAVAYEIWPETAPKVAVITFTSILGLIAGAALLAPFFMPGRKP